MNELLDWVLGAVAEVDPVARILLAGLGMLLETSVFIGLLVPGDAIVLIASMAIENWVQYAATFAIVVAGAIAGESIGFLLGRSFGPGIRRSWLGARLGEANWARADDYLRRRGGMAVFLSRFLPVLHSLVPLLAGMGGMRYRRFLAWTVPACLLWTALYVSFGWLAADSYRRLSAQLHWAGYAFVGIVLVFILLTWLAKRVLLRSERRHLPGTTAPDAAPAPRGGAAIEPSMSSGETGRPRPVP